MTIQRVNFISKGTTVVTMGVNEVLSNDVYRVVSVDGLSSIESTINSLPVYDRGSAWVGSHIGSRRLTFTIAVEGSIESQRRSLTHILTTGSPITAEFVIEGMPYSSAKTHGYVQSIQADIFSTSRIIQLVVDCPDPMLYLPFVPAVKTSQTTCTFTNTGDDPVGVIIDIVIGSVPVNFVFGFTISFGGNNVLQIADLIWDGNWDILRIDSRRGNKSVGLYAGSISQNTLHENALPLASPGFSWISIPPTGSPHTVTLTNKVPDSAQFSTGLGAGIVPTIRGL